MASAILWDMRGGSDASIAELDGHVGPVKFIHMDPYKVVTGGPNDHMVNVWETDTGSRANSLNCAPLDDSTRHFGCSAMAVDGQRIITASGDDELCILRFRDFSPATCHVSSNVPEAGLKFWDSQSFSSDSEDLKW